MVGKENGNIELNCEEVDDLLKYQLDKGIQKKMKLSVLSEIHMLSGMILALFFVAGRVFCSYRFGLNNCVLVQKGQLHIVNCWTVYISLISNWKWALENVFSIQQRQILMWNISNEALFSNTSVALEYFLC